MHDFTARNSKELSVKQGDELTVSVMEMNEWKEG